MMEKIKCKHYMLDRCLKNKTIFIGKPTCALCLKYVEGINSECEQFEEDVIINKKKGSL